jgi:hypothetical protein
MTPPPLATWLLQRLQVNESVTGDLIERHQRKRSSLWYWRQTTVAIIAEATQDARRNKLLAVRAILVGFAVLALFDAGARPLLNARSVGAIWIHGHLFALDQWVVQPMWIVGLPIGGGLAGFVVARFHRPSQMCLFTACLGTWQIGQSVWLAVVQPIGLGDYLICLTLYAMPVVVTVFLGGLWSSQRRHPQLAELR